MFFRKSNDILSPKNLEFYLAYKKHFINICSYSQYYHVLNCAPGVNAVRRNRGGKAIINL